MADGNSPQRPSNFLPFNVRCSKRLNRKAAKGARRSTHKKESGTTAHPPLCRRCTVHRSRSSDQNSKSSFINPFFPPARRVRLSASRRLSVSSPATFRFPSSSHPAFLMACCWKPPSTGSTPSTSASPARVAGATSGPTSHCSSSPPSISATRTSPVRLGKPLDPSSPFGYLDSRWQQRPRITGRLRNK